MHVLKSGHFWGGVVVGAVVAYWVLPRVMAATAGRG